MKKGSAIHRAGVELLAPRVSNLGYEGHPHIFGPRLVNQEELINSCWPAQVETIMVSIISMLSSPNDESPANIDAAKEFRDDKEGFRKHVGRIVRKSQEML